MKVCAKEKALGLRMTISVLSLSFFLFVISTLLQELFVFQCHRVISLIILCSNTSPISLSLSVCVCVLNDLDMSLRIEFMN